MTIKQWLKAKRVIRQIAKTQGLSASKVCREMREAIDIAWATADLDTAVKQQILFPKGKPSVERLIVQLSREIQHV